jgi:hypothetical protein
VLGEAVQQQHRLAFARLSDVHPQPGQVDVRVLDAAQRRQNESVHGRTLLLL